MTFIWFGLALIIGYVLIERSLDVNKSSNKYSYKSRKYLMTKREAVFYKKLLEAIGQNYYVFPQIRLSTLLDHRVKGQNWRGALSKINQKSVDFVICDKTYISPIAAIELDDSTHNSDIRRKRDAEVEEMLEVANLPLIRFVNNHMSIEDIANKVNTAVKTNNLK